MANPSCRWGGTTADKGCGGEQTRPSPPPDKHALPRPLWQELWHSSAGSFVPRPRNYVYSISHNLFSIDSQWICFSTTDDLAQKQTPLKQEPRRPGIRETPLDLGDATTLVHRKGSFIPGTGDFNPWVAQPPPNLRIIFSFQGLGTTQTKDKTSFSTLKPTILESLKPEEIIKSPGLRQPPCAQPGAPCLFRYTSHEDFCGLHRLKSHPFPQQDASGVYHLYKTRVLVLSGFYLTAL